MESLYEKTNGDTIGKNVIKIPISVDENNVTEGASEILKVIRPTWNNDSIVYKLFTDGITNKLVGCFHKPNNMKNELSNGRDPDNCDNGELDNYDDDVVLIRVYGNKTDLLIDRNAEKRNIRLLHTYGFAPSLYATFQNGLAYEYVAGVTLNPKSVIDPRVWKLVARRMAEMHRVECDFNVPKEPCLWTKVQQFLDLIPEQFSNSIVHSSVFKLFLPVQKLRNEFEDLYGRLKKLNSPVVFAHNDLLLGNVIYTESLNRVTFIDYEYAAYNFQAFDIGNHFTEFVGIDEIDYSLYPTKEFQYQWLRVYLAHYNNIDVDDVKCNEIHKLYVQVNQFALVSHIFWAIWGLIQAEHSKIDFDFAKFAKIRYSEYLNKRDEFLALTY